MCSLRFENNLHTIEGVRFDIEENATIKAFVRFRFASVAITNSDIPAGDGAITNLFLRCGKETRYPSMYYVSFSYTYTET
jgi:hypothetical protein